MSRTQPQRGVTLIEVAVSTVLVGVVLVASLETLGGSMRTTRATTETIDAFNLLEQMAAEVRVAPFEDPDGNTSGLGIESGEPASPANRLAFDDVDDYEGFSTSPPASPDGTPVTGYDGWTQSFAVWFITASSASTNLRPTIANDEGLRQVRCQLTSPDGTEHRLWVLRSAYGPSEEPAPFDTTRVTGVEVEVEVGTANPIRKAVAVDNLPEAP